VRLGAHDGALRRWVIDVKHARWEAMGERLGALLGEQLLACGVVGRGDPHASLVPVPMPWLRAHARGIDHSAVLAAAASRASGVRVVHALTQRLVGTQVDRAARTSRVAPGEACARFIPRDRARRVLAGTHAVLVDDVRTTGATLAESARAIRRWFRLPNNRGLSIIHAAARAAPKPCRSRRKTQFPGQNATPPP
jgi:predicted amidophosphoribosyltransferase